MIIPKTKRRIVNHHPVLAVIDHTIKHPHLPIRYLLRNTINLNIAGLDLVSQSAHGKIDERESNQTLT